MSCYSGNSKRHTLSTNGVQVIVVPHENTVAVVDFGPVMHKVANTGDPEQDYVHNRFREGIDEYATMRNIDRDDAVTYLVGHALRELALPTAQWFEDHP